MTDPGDEGTPKQVSRKNPPRKVATRSTGDKNTASGSRKPVMTDLPGDHDPQSRSLSKASKTPETEDLRGEYQARTRQDSRLREEILYVLESLIKQAEIKTHSITGRVKTLESFLDKVESKGYDDPFTQVEDFVGCRIVCLFFSDLEPVASLIRDNFLVVKEENKIESQSVEQFGYMSVHFIVMLDQRYAGPRYAGLHQTVAEIQIRTILMDAWANVAHHLDYKGEASVPSELRKDFFALSGLFYVADRHFELFASESRKAQESARMAVEKSDAGSVELNLHTMSAYLKKEYPERWKEDPASVSELVEELWDSGYTTIDDVDRMLKRATEAFERYEAEHPPSLSPDDPRFDREGPQIQRTRFSGTGLLRISLGLADSAYRLAKYGSDSSFSDYERLVKDQ